MTMLRQRSSSRSSSRGGVSSSRLVLSAAGRLSPALLLLRGVSGSDVVTAAAAAAAAATVADSATVDWVKFSEEQAANNIGTSSSHLRQRSIVAGDEYDWAASAVDRQVDSNNTSKKSGEQRVLTQLKKRSSCTSLPCGECEGDCDRNSDCAGDLVCFQRDSGDPVRGCLGSNTGTKTDYCMKAIYAGADGVELTLAALATEAPTEAPTTSAPTTSLAPTPTPPTISPTTSSVPSVIPTTSSAPTARPTRRPTERPTNRPTTPRPTKNPSGLLDYYTTKNDNLKQECEGDCNSDADCAGDLVCYQREAGDDLPGCEGTPLERTDYCIQPQFTPDPTNRPTKRPTPRPTPRPTREPTMAPTYVQVPGASQPGKIKLYWEWGYFWQESWKEEKYCMTCSRRSGQARGCFEGRKIEIQDCYRRKDSVSRHRSQTFIRLEHDKTIRPAMDPSLCFTHPNVDQDCCNIKDDKKDKKGGTIGTYWNIHMSTVYLSRCEPGNKNQQFYTQGTDWRKNGKFQIHTDVRNKDRCLTQMHHPRPNELVYPQKCDRAMNHQTDAWTIVD